MRHVRMIRQYWREAAFWRWWLTSGAPAGIRAVALLVVLAGVLAAGLLAAERLTGTSADAQQQPGSTFVRTVRRTVTVHEQGTVIRKFVPVVKRVYRRPRTVVQTRTQYAAVPTTVTVPVSVPVTVAVPVRTTVKVPGPTRTVVQTVVRTVTTPGPEVVLVKTVTNTLTRTVTVTTPHP